MKISFKKCSSLRPHREEAVAATDEKVMEQMYRLQELIDAERSAREDLGVQLEAIDMHEMFLHTNCFRCTN